MGELVDRLGKKAPGQLIKSEDWNGLVVAVEDLSVSVNTRFADVNDRLQTFSEEVEKRFQDLDAKMDGKLEELGVKIDALTQGFGDFRGAVEPLLGEYYRLTLETSRSNYAIGELAEITARVTDLRGNPLDLPEPEDRLWIDFVVANWGQLKPAPRFESLGGVGDRTISVRTDERGVARVFLRSDHAEYFTDEDEVEVADSLETRLEETNDSIVETILSAATPMDATVKGAFRALTEEYDRTDATRVSKYADAYFSKNAATIGGRIAPPIFRHRWRDHRSTVMAFARRDGDPVTPDQSRGVSSIQVTFRDWIFPWITIDYFVKTGPLVENLRERLAPKISDDFGRSVINVKTEVKEFVSSSGLIGKQRDYMVVREALAEVDVPRPLPFDLVSLTKPLQDAIGVQQMLEGGQGLGLDGREVAFGAFADAAVQTEDAVVRMDSQVAQVHQEITGYVNEQLQEAREQLQFEVQRAQANFKDQLLADNGPIMSVQKDLQAVTGQVQGVQTALNAKADMQTLARFVSGGISSPSFRPDQ